jgi:segregation and condensation protein A
MVQASEYLVQLDVFSGPLDLLLHLIEQQQLDITTISLARVTDQYLAYLEMVHERRADDLAEFVAIAARLLLIKSRALLPQSAAAEEQEEDAGDDLVRQLREYRRFKQAASLLHERDQAALHMYLRTVPTAKVLNLEPRLDLGETSLGDIIEALRALLQEEAEEVDAFAVEPYEVTIGQRIEHIRGLLRQHEHVQFQELLGERSSRLELIVTLLAVLELIRSRSVTVTQPRLFGPISITMNHSGDARPANAAI